MRALSPLTGLPGNIRVQEEIRRRVAEEQPFSLLYADVDHFKAYNDHYGFVRGDRAIQAMARLASEVVQDLVGPEGFVGHVGGDDFLLIVPPDLAETVAARLCERFDQEAPLLYDRDDVERGYLELTDRQGSMVKFPLVTVSVGVVSTSSRTFSHYGEAVAVATEMKQVAKRQPGSSFAVDRRRD
jgi:diguanylate cyclase (GGDEF)-like protein